MISDECKKVRSPFSHRIVKARQEASVSSKGVRQFIVPEINLTAKSYYSLITWTKIEITEPPLTKNFSLEELVENGENSALWKAEQFSIPCHTQAVERCVKIVTECSTQVASSKRRDGIIRTKLKSRNVMPRFTSKSKYKLQKI